MERIPAQLFNFSTGEHAELYTAILHAFTEANERLETSLSLDGLHERLRTVGWFGAVEDADGQGPGVEIDDAVESVLPVVGSHHGLQMREYLSLSTASTPVAKRP